MTETCAHAEQVRDWAAKEDYDFTFSRNPVPLENLKPVSFKGGKISLSKAEDLEREGVERRAYGGFELDQGKLVIPTLPHGCPGPLTVFQRKELKAFVHNMQMTCIGNSLLIVLLNAQKAKTEL